MIEADKIFCRSVCKDITQELYYGLWTTLLNRCKNRPIQNYVKIKLHIKLYTTLAMRAQPFSPIH